VVALEAQVFLRGPMEAEVQKCTLFMHRAEGQFNF